MATTVAAVAPEFTSGEEDALAGQGKAGPMVTTATEQNVPLRFHKGVAISIWQNSGGLNSNWGEFVEETGSCCGLFPRVMDRSSPNDGGCNFWERYEEDIQLAKNLGVTAFRFSFEWHRLEVQPGVYDAAAVRRYHKILDAIEVAGMVPNATLHHFVHPAWWEERGAFEKSSNLAVFTDYCVMCAREFGSRVKLWATFNEPTCYLVCSYLLGVHPPGKVLRLSLMGRVLLNIMKAHTAAYHAMKSVPACSDLQIGLVHHHVEFMPKNPKHWWIRGLTWWGTFWWGRDTVTRYLQTGEFQWFVPGWGQTIDFLSEQKPGLDWWGINYYTRGLVSGACMPAKGNGELMTDMQYTLYPDSLYENIVRGAALNVPMYITEIGCADRSKDDSLRIANIESSMFQIMRAIRDGYDVRGVYYWTLMDNFEWNAGYSMRFGVYYWDKDNVEQQRTLKEGGRLLARIYSSLPEDLDEVRIHCQNNPTELSDYVEAVRAAQADAQCLPIVWNKGRCVPVAPLSPLHLRIGLQDAPKSQEMEMQPIKASNTVEAQQDAAVLQVA